MLIHNTQQPYNNPFRIMTTLDRGEVAPNYHPLLFIDGLLMSLPQACNSPESRNGFLKSKEGKEGKGK